MIPVTYNYLCSCGYSFTQQEALQSVASYPLEAGIPLSTIREYRLTIDPVLPCFDCKKQLQPTVVVTYAPLQSEDQP